MISDWTVCVCVWDCNLLTPLPWCTSQVYRNRKQATDVSSPKDNCIIFETSVWQLRGVDARGCRWPNPSQKKNYTKFLLFCVLAWVFCVAHPAFALIILLVSIIGEERKYLEQTVYWQLFTASLSIDHPPLCLCVCCVCVYVCFSATLAFPVLRCCIY